MADIDIKIKTAVLVLVLIGGFIFYEMRHPAFAADGTDPSWDAAVRRSHDAGRPAIVLFTAGWCPHCQTLYANVLSRSDVQHELQGHYTFHTVDLTNPSPQAQQHAHKCGINGVPLMIRYDATGRETDRTNGMSAERMIEWLKAGE